MSGGLTAGWFAKLGLVVFTLAFAIAVLLAADGRWAMPAPSGHLRPADGGSPAAAQAAGAALRVSAPLPAQRSLDRLQLPGRRPPKRRVASTRNVAAPVVLREAAPSPEPSPTPTPAATPAPPTPAAPVPVATPVPVARTPVPTPVRDRSFEQPDGASGDFDLTDGSP
jgi:hypothetical protein